MAQNALRDENRIPVMLFVGSDGGTYYAKGDEVTGRLYVDMNGASGGVTGPASSVNENIAVFDGLTGKIIKDGGKKISELQLALGYTAENVANKSTNVTTDGASDTKYPSVKAVKDYADGLVVGLWNDRGSYDASGNTYPATGGSGTAGVILKGDIWTISVAGTLGGVNVDVGDTVRALTDTPGQTSTNWSILENNIGYVPENVANKSTTLDTDKASDTKYPSVKSVYDWATGLFQTLANIRTSFQVTPDDTHYPSEKLTYDQLALKDTKTDLTKYSNLNAPEGFLLNGKIVPSVASNNLTVAIKGIDGNDPSASNPVYCRIGDVVRAITSALSVTKNAGTNWFNAGSAELATQEIDYFVYLGYNATDGVTIGFSRIPYANIYSNFSTTTTDNKYCAISTITNASSNDSYSVIGRFTATLSAGAGYTWTVPTFTPLNLIQKPIYETRTLFWSTQATGFAGTVTYSIRSYKIIIGSIFFAVEILGTSNATTLTFMLPQKPVSQTQFICRGMDNGTFNPILVVPSTDGIVSCFKDVSAGGFTTSGNKRAYISLTLPIN